MIDARRKSPNVTDASNGMAPAANQSGTPPSATPEINLDATIDGESTLNPDGTAFSKTSIGMQSGINLGSNDDLIVVNTSTESVHEKYDIGPVIARGGMGAILASKDTRLRRAVAMKVLLNQSTASREQISRLIHEAQVTGQLEHPNIVPVHELGVDGNGQPFYTMKLIKGTTMKMILEGLRKGDPEYVYAYSLNRLLSIYMRACDAIAFAHSKYVIHRDLKPENIMVGDFGEVLVLDWGLAKVLKHNRHRPEGDPEDSAWDMQEINSARMEDSQVEHTMMGQTIGTPAFMAPEQANGELDRLSDRTDIYSLGAILYNLLALQPPVTGKSVIEILAKVTTGEIADPTTLSHGKGGDAPIPTHCPGKRVPSSLAAVAMKALSYEPDARYQTVLELQSDIEAYLNGFATHAEEATWFRHTALSLKRHKAAAIIGAVSSVVLVGTLTAFVLSLNAQRLAAEVGETAAMENYQKLFESNRARLAVSQQAAPEFLGRAYRNLEQHGYSGALEAASLAISMDPNLLDAYTLRGLLLMREGEYARASADFARIRQDDADATVVAAFTAELERACNAAVVRGGLESDPLDAAGLAALWNATEAENRRPLRLAFFPSLAEGATAPDFDLLWVQRVAEWLPTQLKAANVGDNSLVATAVIEDRKLVVQVSSDFSIDFKALNGLPLDRLTLRAPVVVLSPLEGAPLRELDVSTTNINSVAVIATLPGLRVLRLGGCKFLRDINPLGQCTSLEVLSLPEPLIDLAVLSRLPTLKQVGYGDKLMPVADFLKVAAPTNTPAPSTPTIPKAAPVKGTP